MELSVLKPVHQHEGPFATVYLEGRSPGEDAPSQLRLRWKALREQLEAEGARSEVVEALESTLMNAESGEEQTNGRVVVATPEGVVFDEPWDAALGAGDAAHWTVLPELGAHVRESTGAVRMVVVVADQNGAQVRTEVVAEQHEPRTVGQSEVEGSSMEGPHKPRGQALSHSRIQNRADEALQRNAKDIAEHVQTTASKVRPDVVVLAGEVQARTAVKDELPSEIHDTVVETDRGAGEDQNSEEALTDELLRVAGEVNQNRMRERTGKFHESTAHGTGVQGGESVAKAAEMGAVATLLFEPGVPAAREAFLIKTCADIDSTLHTVEPGTNLQDGVGAVLRFPVNA